LLTTITKRETEEEKKRKKEEKLRALKIPYARSVENKEREKLAG